MKLLKCGLALAFVFGLILVTGAAVQAQDNATRDSAIAATGPDCPGTLVLPLFESPGDAFLWDVSGMGNLKVSTRDCCVEGDRWRATIAKIPADGAQSRVGNGGTINFSGEITRQIAANFRYVVMVTWDELTGIPDGLFPAGMDVCFETTGSVVVTPRY